ncbi:MAG TPA: hypothetical protein VFA94_15565 [Acidimicrobiales bacterium]|nr:hypothetical protein [Acidimicrobiales bacterium]
MEQAMEVVRARRFELVDARGDVRAVLGVADGESEASLASLTLIDSAGYPRVVLATVDETASLSFWDSGNTAASLGVGEEGYASLVLYRDNGEPMARIDNQDYPMVDLPWPPGRVRRHRRRP